MSKILLIEPDRMLRQAFTLALFPEHELMVCGVAPESEPKDFSLAIVDGSALAERGLISAEAMGQIAKWKLPVIWIDDKASAPASEREKLARLNRPVSKEALQRALAECLGKVPPPIIAKVIAPSPVDKPALKARVKRKTGAAPGESQFIELVDVVEESTAEQSAEAK